MDSPAAFRAFLPWGEEGQSARAGKNFRRVLDALPAAIYTTDAVGRITYFNQAATALWGREPALGSEWCGSWKLFHQDGRPMGLDECPMAIAIREQRPVRGVEIVAERPDGKRVPVMPYPTPLFDEKGRLVGAVNMLVEIADRKRADELAHHLSAVVSSSDDAIVSKNLDGIVQSWNKGAERLFGYTAAEAIGRPVTILVPADRRDEEPGILARIRRGERIESFETVRRRKDGGLIHVSLTVSPIKDTNGKIVGASKSARDITERKQAQERQDLLLREIEHRVRNLFALAGGIVTLSAHYAKTPQELTKAIHARLSALDQAHALTLARPAGDARGPGQDATLHALVKTILSPYRRPDLGGRFSIEGPDCRLAGTAFTGMTLLLHEFATNAAKYGALSSPAGHIEIACAKGEDAFVLTWTERGGPRVEGKGAKQGFGSALLKNAAEGYLGGGIVQDWRPEGLVIRATIAGDRLAD